MFERIDIHLCCVPFATSEAKTFPNAVSSINWRELFQAIDIHIHGMWISGGV